jgi:hypothetical protein
LTPEGGLDAFSRWLGDGLLARELPPESPPPPMPAEESQWDGCIGASGFNIAVEYDLRNTSRRFRAD